MTEAIVLLGNFVTAPVLADWNGPGWWVIFFPLGWFLVIAALILFFRRGRWGWACGPGGRGYGRLLSPTEVEFGGLDAAFNNAGGGHAFGPLTEIDLEEFDDELAVNLRGVFVSMKHEIPAMLEGGGGAIVNNASTAGIQAARGISVYSA